MKSRETMSRLRSNPQNKRIKQIPAESVINKFRDHVYISNSVLHCGGPSLTSSSSPTSPCSILRNQTRSPGVGRQVNYVADPSGLRAHIRTNEVAAAPQYVSPYLVNPYYRSFGHDGLVYPQYGLGYNRFGLGYGYNGPFSTDTVTEILWATVVFLEIMLSTMEFLLLNECNQKFVTL
ncbi:hypothetical protein CEXT_487821 [Caerostris extrusa]|uniref:Uncharacterized protein n=1 Tax=Caerostris extrusa TaxID=172846 RepID=A0AAV4UIX2_CAEEX|nr:hypothetical protein CEXT_487821 [Caerostris extrusa]